MGKHSMAKAHPNSFDNNGNPLGPPTIIIDHARRIAFL
jgi:hypothetical protein